MEELRKLIRECLQEAQRSKGVDNVLNGFIQNADINTPEGVHPAGLSVEIKNAIKAKLNYAQQSNYDYDKLYILKLGNFILKDKGQRHAITFNVDIPEIKAGGVANFPYVFVFNDIVMRLAFGSEFFTTDNILEDKAKKFMEQSDFKGEIIHKDFLSRDNILTLRDERGEEEGPEKSLKAPELERYYIGKNYTHPKFGPGKITGVNRKKKDKDGNPILLVKVKFKAIKEPKTFQHKTEKEDV